MADLVFDKKTRRNLHACEDEETRLGNTIAILIGELEWRRMLLGVSDEEIRADLRGREPGGDREDTEALDNMLRLLHRIADGKEKPRVTRVRFDAEEQQRFDDETAVLPSWERERRRKEFEIKVLMERTEEVAAQLGAEKIASRHQYSPAREAALQDILGKLGLKGASEIKEEIERELYRPQLEEHRCITVQGEKCEYVYDLEDAVWHRFDKADFIEDPRGTVPFSLASCGKRFLGPPEAGSAGTFNRIFVMMYLATTEREEMSICRACLPGLDEQPTFDGGFPL